MLAHEELHNDKSAETDIDGIYRLKPRKRSRRTPRGRKALGKRKGK
jgi:hypothetical protein